jgi:hypothetical protein
MASYRRDGGQASTAQLEGSEDRYGRRVGLRRLLICRSVLGCRVVAVLWCGGEQRDDNGSTSKRTYRGW